MSILCSGSFVADILVPNLPYIGPPGSLTYAPKGIHLSPGGHSANVSIDLAQLGEKDVTAVGCVGDDQIGKFLVDQLKHKNVKPQSEINHDMTTAKNVALLVEGEDRRFIAELTANSQLSPSHLKGIIQKVMPSIFYQGTVGGLNYIDPSLPEILGLTHGMGALNVLDIIMPSVNWSHLPVALPFVDVFHCNQLEASTFTGLDDPFSILRQLTSEGVDLVVVSDGENGLTAGTKDFHVSMPAFKVPQVDATGAGDALCAGLVHRLKQGDQKKTYLDNVESCIDLLLYGQATGAACVTGIGATTNVTNENVTKILKEQKDSIYSQTKTRKQ